MSTVFDFLSEVERRPGMYFLHLRDLEKMLYGYGVALSQHSIDEGVPHMLHFAAWLRRKTEWSMSCGWASAFDDHVASDEQTERFFELVAQFKRLHPAIVASVDLDERHQPTGKRVVIGFGDRMARPNRIEVVQYRPESLHYLRFIYPTHTEVDHILAVHRSDGTLDSDTDVRDAKKWAADEFQVRTEDWN